jgi:hypothetical protein
MTGRASAAPLDAATSALVARIIPAGHPIRTIARIRATVDRDRVARELGLAVEDRPRDPLLGASVGLVRPPAEGVVALLEPDREGRLAAWVARHGEGWAGWYLEAADGLEAASGRAVSAGIGLSGAAAGPFGRSVLVVGGRPGDPHLVLVDRPAGTIAR